MVQTFPPAAFACLKIEGASMRLTALGLAALGAVACTTPIRGLDRDPSFNQAAIGAGGLAVGGVVDARRQLDPALRTSYADLLRTALRSERPDLTILPAAAVVSALGESHYEEMLREYREVGAPSAQFLRMLSKRIDRARYLVLARIDQDRTRRWTTEEDVTDSKGKQIGSKTRYRHGRTVDVSLRIFDLDDGSTAWSGSIEKSSSNENTEDDPFPDPASSLHKRQSVGKDLRDAAVAGLALGVLGALLDDGSSSPAAPRDPYPDPPDERSLLEQAFRGFAENLPKP
jgi:hypothetical protein